MGKDLKQSFIASVHDEYLDNIHTLAEELKKQGAEIQDIHQITGVITGQINKESLDKLKIEGISSVNKSRKIKKK
jgi:hypothetical protein